MRIQDLTGALPTLREYSRREWPPTHLIVHHSATPPTVTPWIIAHYHTEIRGYPGIAYHALVYDDGTLYQTNDWDAISWHAGCAAVHGPNCPDNPNLYAIGVCLVGDFTSAIPPPAQITAALELAAYLEHLYGPLKIIGHREAHGANTSCPGDTWEVWHLEATMEQAKIRTARWQCEEAVREIERVLAVLEIPPLREARKRLLEEAIPRLYELEHET